MSKRYGPWARRRRWLFQRVQWCFQFRGRHSICFGISEGFLLSLALAFSHGFFSLNELPFDVFVLLFATIGMTQRPLYAMSFGVVLALGWDALAGLGMGASFPILSAMLMSSQLLKLYLSPAQSKTVFDFRAVIGGLIFGAGFHLFIPEFLNVQLPHLSNALSLIATLLTGFLLLGFLSFAAQAKAALSSSPNGSRSSLASSNRLSFVS